MPAAAFSGELLHASIPAAAAAEIFLIANGWNLQATDAVPEDLTFEVAEGTIAKVEVVSFFGTCANRHYAYDTQ
jgi:hypothetical protein